MGLSVFLFLFSLSFPCGFPNSSSGLPQPVSLDAQVHGVFYWLCQVCRFSCHHVNACTHNHNFFCFDVGAHISASVVFVGVCVGDVFVGVCGVV